MLEFLNKIYHDQIDLKSRLRIGLWMGVGIFLFLLFFQPFDIVQADLNNYNLIIAGFGGITLMLQGLIHLSLAYYLRQRKSAQLNLKLILLFEFLLWSSNAVAYSFYLRYVGHVPLSMFLVFRIVLISLVPLVVNLIVNDLKDLKNQLTEAIANNRQLAEMADNLTGEAEHAVELLSESRSEHLSLDLKSLIMIRSADNYVEVHYRDEGSIHKKLLRTTLRKIEEQLRIYAVMVRCHRNCIVNISHVEKLKRTSEGIKLVMRELEEDLAVSRQYFLGVKAALG